MERKKEKKNTSLVQKVVLWAAGRSTLVSDDRIKYMHFRSKGLTALGKGAD